MTELDLHQSVADFLDWILLPPAVWTTFPAGWTGMRTGAAGRLKACGLKAGMPDALIFYDSRTIGIELKAKTKPSIAQIEMFNKLRMAGVPVHVVTNVEQVPEILITHCIPMRKFTNGKNFKAPEGRRPKEPPQGASAP